MGYISKIVFDGSISRANAVNGTPPPLPTVDLGFVTTGTLVWATRYSSYDDGGGNTSNHGEVLSLATDVSINGTEFYTVSGGGGFGVEAPSLGDLLHVFQTLAGPFRYLRISPSLFGTFDPTSPPDQVKDENLLQVTLFYFRDTGLLATP
jgi:hypothetical protein